ncbi:hypothetical protein ABFA07_019460 [Porites harrisoni]
MASKPLTPQTAAMASLREFENALESLKSAFCLYAECKDLSDPYDDHQQPRRNELRRTFKLIKIGVDALKELIEVDQVFRVSDDESDEH